MKDSKEGQTNSYDRATINVNNTGTAFTLYLTDTENGASDEKVFTPCDQCNWDEAVCYAKTFVGPHSTITWNSVTQDFLDQHGIDPVRPEPIDHTCDAIGYMYEGQKTFIDSRDVNEVLTTQPDYYHNAPFDVMEAQGYICQNFRRSLRNMEDANLWDEVDEEGRVWSVGAATKHLSRLGCKDGVFYELLKIENYSHRARTGKWMPKKKEIKKWLLEALGEASAIFMSQECKGTEIVMPTKELEKIATELTKKIYHD